jgi:hypothetical protein
MTVLSVQLPQNACLAQSETLNTLSWSIINTPSAVNNIISEGSEVNFIAVGSDDRTIYAVDIANNALYKSEDKGSTWNQNLSAYLTAAGAVMPVWNIAIAPDNSNMIVAVTSDAGMPRKVFISTDGGVNWDDTLLTAPSTLNTDISAIAISPLYSSTKRDVIVGTRKWPSAAAVGGAVYVMKTPGISSWADQTVAPSVGWAIADVISLEFSPNYNGDSGIIAIISTATDTYLNTAIHDVVANSTTWNAIYPSPGVEIVNTAVGGSPGAAQIIVADISLPQDFDAADIDHRVYYVSYYDNSATLDSGIYRRNDNEGQFHYLLPDTSTRGISSIDYFGTVASGKLLAGEVNADVTTFISDIWITYNPQTNPPTWDKADKPPTGGANKVNILGPARHYANAQLAWSSSGNRAYCGTSSADINPPAGPTSGWPNGYLLATPLDESAFSVSPYSADYQLRVDLVDKDVDNEVGYIWNQLGLIDTRMTNLADVATLEVAETSTSDYNILYLASSNIIAPGDSANIINYFDSVWRSTTPRLGDKWERVACPLAANHDLIMRVYSGSSYLNSNSRSDVLTYTDRLSKFIYYSPDEGQSWESPFNSNINIKDVSLGSDSTIYAMDDSSVRRCQNEDLGWLWGSQFYTGFIINHSLYALPEDAQPSTNNKYNRWVFVGDETQGQVAYIDFAADNPRFTAIKPAPVAGYTHVVAHDKFIQNHAIFAAINDFTGTTGKMYRWILGESTEWTLLQPPDDAFYGVVLDQDVLYGAWRTPAPPTATVGVDRTLTSLYITPPPLEWSDLTVNITAGVRFTREPSALKTSSNDNNTLWAIDNNNYDWANQTGCLWYFIDTLAKKGPKPIAPPSDGLIAADPVTGRSSEVNFTWYQLNDASVYELQLSKDDQFSKQLIVNTTIGPTNNTTVSTYNTTAMVPIDQTAPAWILPPGFLEDNHKYYWRLRATGGIEGQNIYSPYSATMSFTVGQGLSVTSPYLGISLLSPVNACGCPCDSPVSFTWTPLKDITTYRFELSENADMSSALVSKDTSTTSFKYDGKLKCNTNYFWRVRATEPFPSDWSATFSFLTQPESKPGNPVPAQSASKPGIPLFAIILMIVIGVVLFIAILILIKKRPSFISTSGNPSMDIHSSISGLGNPIRRIFSRNRKDDYQMKSSLSSSDDSLPGATKTSNNEGFFTRVKNVIIMPLRRRRYLSPSKNKKDKFF